VAKFEKRGRGMGIHTLSLQFPRTRTPFVPFVMQRRINGEKDVTQKFPPPEGHGAPAVND
jgi:hypothetical protein